MSIGDELFAASEILKRGESPREDWKYGDYFTYPDLQPTPKAFDLLMEYGEFWALEPPVLAVHMASTVMDRYYRNAILRVPCQSLATFGEGYSEPVMGVQSYHFDPDPGDEWMVPHLMSFCDYHIISDSSDSWWGAVLSDDLDVIYPIGHWDEAPTTWKGIEL